MELLSFVFFCYLMLKSYLHKRSLCNPLLLQMSFVVMLLKLILFHLLFNMWMTIWDTVFRFFFFFMTSVWTSAVLPLVKIKIIKPVSDGASLFNWPGLRLQAQVWIYWFSSRRNDRFLRAQSASAWAHVTFPPATRDDPFKSVLEKRRLCQPIRHPAWGFYVHTVKPEPGSSDAGKCERTNISLLWPYIMKQSCGVNCNNSNMNDSGLKYTLIVDFFFYPVEHFKWKKINKHR